MHLCRRYRVIYKCETDLSYIVNLIDSDIWKMFSTGCIRAVGVNIIKKYCIIFDFKHKLNVINTINPKVKLITVIWREYVRSNTWVCFLMKTFTLRTILTTLRIKQQTIFLRKGMQYSRHVYFVEFDCVTTPQPPRFCLLSINSNHNKIKKNRAMRQNKISSKKVRIFHIRHRASLSIDPCSFTGQSNNLTHLDADLIKQSYDYTHRFSVILW